LGTVLCFPDTAVPSDHQTLRIAEPNGEMARCSRADIKLDKLAKVRRGVHRYGLVVEEAVELMGADRNPDRVVVEPHHATARLGSDKKRSALLQLDTGFSGPHIVPRAARLDALAARRQRNAADDKFEAAPGEPIEAGIQLVRVGARRDGEKIVRANEVDIE